MTYEEMIYEQQQQIKKLEEKVQELKKLVYELEQKLLKE